MLFPTITFAIFFLVVYVLSWLLMPRLRLWKWFILAASYLFYGWWDWRLVGLLAAVTVANQALGVAVHRARGGRDAAAYGRVEEARGRGAAHRHDMRALGHGEREHGRRGEAAAARGWLFLAIAVNLATLAVFKYFDFFAVNLNEVLDAFGLGAPLPYLHVIMPVGISFLIFRMLAYVIDLYRGELAPAPALDFAVYAAFFPYLLAGPIARPGEMLVQLTAPRDPHAVDSSRAFVLILGGLAKKLLIADYLSTHIVGGLFASPGTYSSWETLWGILAYSVQIYCDFSAYSDIAIGISLLLGFKLPDNFAAPYTARTIQEFWRRWHITLSSWLRDYLYIPLGGNRKGRRRTYVNLVVTFLLGGLWHGAGWTFVFWGFMHGIGLAIERARTDVRRNRGLPAPGRTFGARLLQRVWVFAFVSAAWVFFRAESLGNALAVFWRLIAGLGSIGSTVTWPIVGLVVLGIAVQYVPRRVVDDLEVGLSRIGWIGQGLVLAVALFLIDVLGPAGSAEFLYFKF